MSKLVLKSSELVFANLKDEGFGTSLTIKVTPENEKLISKFWASEKIGNEKTVIGVANFKMYEETKQLSLKINDKTKFAYIAGTNEQSLGFGAICDIILNSFEYTNKFTKGKTYIGCSVSAVVVVSGRKTGADADLAELLGERQSEPQSESNPFEEKVNESGLPF